MGLFTRRNRHPEPSSTPDQIPPVLTEDAEATEQQTSRSYRVEVDERLASISEQRDSLVRDALSRGVSEEAIPGLIADAMNAHQIPRVLQDSSVGRGGLIRFQTIDGTISGDDLRVDVLRAEDGSLQSTQVGLNGPTLTLEDGGAEPSFSVGYSPNIPVTPDAAKDSLVGPEVFAKIDAYMETVDPQQTAN